MQRFPREIAIAAATDLIRREEARRTPTVAQVVANQLVDTIAAQNDQIIELSAQTQALQVEIEQLRRMLESAGLSVPSSDK